MFFHIYIPAYFLENFGEQKDKEYFPDFRKSQIRDNSFIGPSICICWLNPTGSIFKTVFLTTVPANPYYWPKSAEPSFTADLSEPRKFSLVGMCKIDKRSGIQSIDEARIFQDSCIKPRGPRRIGAPRGPIVSEGFLLLLRWGPSLLQQAPAGLVGPGWGP